MKELRTLSDYSIMDYIKAAGGLWIVTGEACSYSGRLLCGLSNGGLALLQEFLGVEIKLDTSLTSSDSAGHIFLPRSIFFDYAVFLLFKKAQAQDVFLIEKDTGYTLIATNDEEDTGKYPIKEFLDKQTIKHHWWLMNQPRRGLANIHTMSGTSMPSF